MTTTLTKDHIYYLDGMRDTVQDYRTGKLTKDFMKEFFLNETQARDIIYEWMKNLTRRVL